MVRVHRLVYKLWGLGFGSIIEVIICGTYNAAILVSMQNHRIALFLDVDVSQSECQLPMRYPSQLPLNYHSLH